MATQRAARGEGSEDARVGLESTSNSSSVSDARLSAARDRVWVPGTEGRSLDHTQRDYHETKLGVDLSSVQLHHDTSRARLLGAAAYSTGDHIVSAGTDLQGETLSHELVHVAQWRTHRAASETVDGRRRAEDNAARIGADLAVGRWPREPLTPPGGPLQRDPLPSSLTEVTLEGLISSTLSRNVLASDNVTALRRVADVTEEMSRLNAHDSMVLHGRLLTGNDALAVLFRTRLARATRARLLAQLLRQSARGGETPPPSTAERDYFAGLNLQVPTWTVLVDPLAHTKEDIFISVLAKTPQPDDLELVADWTVERVSSSGEVNEVTHFELPWMPGMTITPTYTIEWTDTGMHYVTVRFRNEVGDIVHIARGSYFVTTEIPQTLAELQGHPQYVDSFTSANYDPDFRPDKPGHLSYWVGVDSTDGWAYVDTRDVYNTGTDATEFQWRDGRIFPGEMNPTTTPGLVALKRDVTEWMDEYNTMFIIGAFVSGVFPILTMAPMTVGPMETGGGGLSRLRMPGVRAPRGPMPPPGAVTSAGGGLQGGAMRTTVTSETTILDADLAISLDRASQGLPLQEGLQTQAVSSLGGTRVAATPTAVDQLATGQVGASMTVPITRTTGTAAERAAITADLAAARVGGGAAGAADREVIAEAALAQAEPGVTPVFATGDRGIINKLAAMPGTGINTLRLGRYQNVAEYLFYVRGGARTFAVTIHGRPMIIRPIQPVRPGM